MSCRESDILDHPFKHPPRVTKSPIGDRLHGVVSFQPPKKGLRRRARRVVSAPLPRRPSFLKTHTHQGAGHHLSSAAFAASSMGLFFLRPAPGRRTAPPPGTEYWVCRADVDAKSTPDKPGASPIGGSWRTWSGWCWSSSSPWRSATPSTLPSGGSLTRSTAGTRARRCGRPNIRANRSPSIGPGVGELGPPLSPEPPDVPRPPRRLLLPSELLCAPPRAYPITLGLRGNVPPVDRRCAT